jgi:hypothetical protein
LASGPDGTRARRRALAGLAVAVSLAMVSLPTIAGAAPPCEAPRGFAPQKRLESPDAVVLYRTIPPAIEVGQHFAVEAVVCPAPRDGAPGLRVDARMPEHRHGMNYRPRVVKKGDGLYVAEGLLFHMPGLWQLMFDVERGGQTERLMTDIDLE